MKNNFYWVSQNRTFNVERQDGFLWAPYLDKRKKVLADNINLEQLSKLTENYVCSDIKLIVNDASRIARKSKCKISQEMIEQIIKQTIPTIR